MIPLFNSSTKKKEVSSTQPNSHHSQYIYPTPFSFNNSLMYPNLFFLFSQVYGESPYCFLQTPIQSQGSVNTNVLHENYVTDGYTNTITNGYANMNANTNTNTNTNEITNIIQNDVSTTQLRKLTIEQFLEDLDKEYGIGMFTKYLNAFKEQEVDVLDIVNFKDSDWITLGIDKIGPKSKIIGALDKYSK